MKKAFFQYVGEGDSLAGYQKSNRLVLLKSLFSLVDDSGKVLVSDIIKTYKRYYELRKVKGFIADVGADIVIHNVENASSADILNVIKRHPFRLLNEKGYLTILNINNQDYFAFNDKLMSELSYSDIRRLSRIVDKKLDLYFSKIDINHSENNDKLVNRSKSIDIHFLGFDLLGSDSIDMTNNYTDNDRLATIYDTFQLQYKKGKKYIALDDYKLGFTASDVQLIRDKEELFYLCSTKRALLIIWIVEAIDRLFSCNNKVLEIDDIYEYLRKHFSLSSFNKKKLKKFFNCEDRVIISQFKKIKKNAEDKVNAIPISNLNKSTNMRESIIEKPAKTPITGAFKACVEYLLEIDKYNEDIDIKLLDDEFDNLYIYESAIEEIGIGMCQLGYQFPEKAIVIVEALNDFSRFVDGERQRVRVLAHCYNNIAITNLNAKIEPLILAYSKIVEIQSAIFKCISGCKYIFELNHVVELVAKNDNIYEVFVDFLRWLHKDIRDQAKMALDSMFKNDRQREIAKARASGATLEEVGTQFGLTRERIRQIEMKVERSFTSFYSRYKPNHILSAFSKLDIGFDENDIRNVFENNPEIFIYFIKRKERKDLLWADELSIFIVGDVSWYNDITKEIENLPDQISSNKVIDIAIKIKKKFNLLMDTGAIQKIIVSFYKQIGEYFTKSRMTKKDMYKVIIEKYYPNGIKLFDDFEMMRFKARFKDIFSDINLDSDDTRAISTRITDFTILCGRGKYILPSAIQVNQKLLNDIHEFILNHERSTIMFAEIFQHFKKRLKEESNIYNRYFLQGVLKHYWNEDFSFSRDTICKGDSIKTNIRSYIENFVKNSSKPVTTKDIKAEFSGVTDIVINLALTENSDILQWGFGEYIHASLIDIDDEEAQKFKWALNAELEDGTVSARGLYEHIFEREQDLLNNNKIYNYTSLFSIYQYLFTDEYSFSRPYISRGHTGMTTDAVIEEYVASFDELSIVDLKLFLEEKHIKITNYSALLDEKCKDFLRVDDDLLIRSTNLIINESVVEDVQNSIFSTLGDKGYMAARNYDDFFFFPYVGVKWTNNLLVSFIKQYCKKLSISQYAIDHRYLTEIIYKKELDAKNHEELIRHALRYEDAKAKFKNIDEIQNFLKTEGLIATTATIPKELYANRTIEIIGCDIKIN